MMHLSLFVWLHKKKVFPCLAKFVEHSALNSQSVIACIFFIVLKSLGRNLLRFSKYHKYELNEMVKIGLVRLVNFSFRFMEKSCKSLYCKSSPQAHKAKL